MKTLATFTIMSIVLLAINSYALTCRSQATMDSGLVLGISKGLHTASLNRLTIAGSRNVARFTCQPLSLASDGQDITPANDSMLTILTCHDLHRTSDSGYLVEVRQSTTGITIANLSEETLAGPKPIAQLYCQ